MAIRVHPIHAPIIDQADFFQADFFTRITGLTNASLSLALFLNNVEVAWPLITGTGVSDVQIASGNVYFHELTVAGYYGVRFKPNAIGYWRVVLNYAVGVQSVALDYDVVSPAALPSGLKASFTR